MLGRKSSSDWRCVSGDMRIIAQSRMAIHKKSSHLDFDADQRLVTRQLAAFPISLKAQFRDEGPYWLWFQRHDPELGGLQRLP